MRPDLAHGRAGRDEEHVVGNFLNFASGRRLALTKTLVDHRIQFRFLKRFRQVVLRPQAHGLHNLLGIVYAGKHYDPGAGTFLADLLQRFQAIDSRHQHIQEHQIRLHAFVNALESFFPG